MREYPYFPIFIDLTDKKIVVIGAGTIAARRILTLTAFAPDIQVVAPEVHPSLSEAEETGIIRVARREFRISDLDDASMVLAATDNRDLNAEICRHCHERGILVNDCSDQSRCDFYFPGIARSGDVVAGVTASGADHRTARMVTEKIRRVLEDQGGD